MRSGWTVSPYQSSMWAATSLAEVLAAEGGRVAEAIGTNRSFGGLEDACGSRRCGLTDLEVKDLASRAGKRLGCLDDLHDMEGRDLDDHRDNVAGVPDGGTLRRTPSVARRCGSTRD